MRAGASERVVVSTEHESDAILRAYAPVRGRFERRADPAGRAFRLASEHGPEGEPVLEQSLIADIATRLALSELAAIDTTVADALRQLAEVLQLDRVMLWRKAADDACAVASHCWVSPRASHPDSLQTASLPFITSRLEAGDAVWFTRVDEVPSPVDRETVTRQGIRSEAFVPLALAGGAPDAWSALAFGSTRDEHDWPPALVDELRLVSAVFSQALARKASLTALQRTRDELEQLRAGNADEALRARPHVKVLRASSRLIVSESAAVRQVLSQVEQVAKVPSTVLLLGETGVGKEVLAQTIHELSPRHQRQMIRVSCAAIPSALIESELFGRERGAYTGALTRQIGRFEAANQSTLFLDEIGELSAEMQIKLLRVLQERVIERLGSTQSIKVDVRIIAATNRNLAKAVEDGAFREDLFYRLNVFPIVVPPLRERAEDIPALVWEFVNEFSRSLGKPIDSIAKESMLLLQRYAWPGNIRELRNVIERAVILSTGPKLTIPMPQRSGTPQRPSMTLKNVEAEHIRAILETTNWRVRGHGGAAERLGLKPTTLETRMAKLGVMRPADRRASAHLVSN